MRLRLPHINLKSLKHQMAFMLSIMAVSMIGFFLFSLVSYYNLQFDTLKTSQDEKTTQVLHNINYNYDYFSKLATSLAYNEMVQEFLISTDREEQLTLFNSISSLLINTQNQESSIIDIAVLGFNGNSANVTGDMSITETLLNELPKDMKSIYFFGNQDYFVYSKNTPCIIATKWIYPLDIKNDTPCGAVFLILDPNHFLGNTYDTDSQQFIFLDQSKELISGDEQLFDIYQNNLASGKTADSNYTMEVHEIPNVSYQLVTFFPKAELVQNLLRTVGGQYFLIFLIFIVICGILGHFITQFFKMLNHLIDIMTKINAGNRKALKERIDVNHSPSSSIEAQAIGTAFNHMLDEIDTLNHDIFNSYSKMYETQIYAKRTELAFLRSQINPHFLYNTLALIGGMSTEGRSTDIINICQALAQILRYSIKGSEFVSFRQEFEIIKSYLMIQSTRFEGRFTIQYKISEEIMDARIPKMILQPLVENAIVHGLEDKLDTGYLELGALRDLSNNTLVLWIYDTGQGISSEKLEEIRKSLAYQGDNSPQLETSEAHDSIGLSNVNSRIRLYYGNEYHLNVDSKCDVGTNIQIRIPFELPEGGTTTCTQQSL